MKLIDTETNVLVADIITNHSMCIDEVLELMRITVDDEGQLFDEDTATLLDACYENLDMIY